MDMSEAYITAVQQQLPTAQIVFDRFHVQQLVSKALDDTRRAEWRRLRGIDKDKEEAKGVKGLRWPLLKNPWNLTPSRRAVCRRYRATTAGYIAPICSRKRSPIS